jgi:HSP20 family protein
MDEVLSIRKTSNRQHHGEDEMEFIFSNFFNSKYPILLTSEKRWHPPTDVFETEAEYIVVMDIANVKQEDIQLTYEGGVLTVSGVRREFQISEKRHYHKMEIDFGPFERKIKINARIVDNSIKACYDNGFLIIKLTKDSTRTAKVTNIQVE